MRLGRSIVERAEPLVERDHAVGVVHLEILMMQVMGVVGNVHGCLVAHHQAIEPRMALGRRNAQPRCQIDHVDRMRRNDEEQQDAGKIDQVLDRMHG